MAEVIVTSQRELERIIRNSISEVLLEQEQSEKKARTELLSVSEASAFLQLAPQTLYGFTSKRTIPFIKKGKKLYFKQSDLEKWLETGRKQSKAEIEKEFDNK